MYSADRRGMNRSARPADAYDLVIYSAAAHLRDPGRPSACGGIPPFSGNCSGGFRGPGSVS
jgi:hypothetical protein